MNLAPRSFLALSLALGAAAACFSFAPEALAADSCKADADCGAGFYCELLPAPSVGCASTDGSPCPEPTPAPADTQGYCREKPISCTSDADCPAYLGCVAPSSGGVTCAAPACPPGSECPEPVCDQPPPKEEPKLCAPKIIECTSDAQCPANFACNIETGSVCSAVACAPGSDCPEPTCEPSKKACGPKEITCKADSECPTDWRCITFVEGDCSSSGGTGTAGAAQSGGGTETPVPPSPGSKTLDSDPSCTTTSRSLCAPRGYLAGIEQGGAAPLTDAKGSAVAEGADNGSSKEAPNYAAPTKGSATQATTPGASSSDDGCSTGGRPGDRAGLLGALVLGLAARLARRKR